MSRSEHCHRRPLVRGEDPGLDHLHLLRLLGKVSQEGDSWVPTCPIVKEDWRMPNIE